MKVSKELLFPRAFYEKSPFFGSQGKWNYRIDKYKKEVDGEEAKSYFRFTYWEGPECFASSKKEKFESFFEYSDEGMEEIMDIINHLN